MTDVVLFYKNFIHFSLLLDCKKSSLASAPRIIPLARAGSFCRLVHVSYYYNGLLFYI